MVQQAIKIELSKIYGAIVMPGKGQYEGQDLVILPVENCHLYKNEKTGAVSLDLLAHLRQTPSQYGDTHFLTQSLSKEVRQGLSDDQLKEMTPIVGNAKPWGNSSAIAQPQPVVQPQPAIQAPAYQDVTPQSGDNGDLPF